MKKIFLISLSILFMSAIVFAQNNYYWSAGKKYYLKADTAMYIVKFSGTGETRMQNIRTLQNNKEIRYVTPLKDDLGIILAGGGVIDF